MKHEVFISALQKIALAAASATVLGGGSMLIKMNTENATQDLRIERVERAVEKIDKLSDKLDETNKNIIVLGARMEAANERERKARE